MHTAIIGTEELMGGMPVALGDEDSHHMRSVLRVSEGEPVRLVDGRGNMRAAVAVSVSKGGVVCEFRGGVGTLPRPRPHITLFQCVAKPVRMDWLVEKAQELGVERIVPVVSERVVARMRRGEKQDRWGRIVASALRQCGGAWLTDVAPVEDWAGAIEEMLCFPGPVLIGALSDAARPIGEVLESIGVSGRGESAGWLIGPEGDFAPGELTEALALQNAIAVSLGGNVLRVETAAIFAIAGTLAYMG